MDPAVLDDIIRRLLDYRNPKAGTKQAMLNDSEIRQLCFVSREIFLQQPCLLELAAPVKICGILLLSRFISFFPVWDLRFFNFHDCVMKKVCIFL